MEKLLNKNHSKCEKQNIQNSCENSQKTKLNCDKKKLIIFHVILQISFSSSMILDTTDQLQQLRFSACTRLYCIRL